ncbi:5517_t:CDS:1, partial [Scutellospora calospora]
ISHEGNNDLLHPISPMTSAVNGGESMGNKLLDMGFLTIAQGTNRLNRDTSLTSDSFDSFISATSVHSQ